MFQVLSRLSSKSYLAPSQNEKVIKYTHSRTHTHILQERISLWKKKNKKNTINTELPVSQSVRGDSEVRSRQGARGNHFGCCFFPPRSMSKFSLEVLAAELEIFSALSSVAFPGSSPGKEDSGGKQFMWEVVPGSPRRELGIEEREGKEPSLMSR